MLDLPHACARAKRLTKLPFKFTLTGPHMLTKTLMNKHYKSNADLARALAAVLAEQVKHIDADVVQIDEANLPGSPDEWPWAAEAINLVLDAVRRFPPCIFASATMPANPRRKGSAKLIAYLNALHVDHVVMENAHRPLDELTVFRDLRPDIGFGLGVVDIKTTVIESADQIARMIERAETAIGAGRIKYIHPDCGFWMLKRTIADGKIRALAAGRDLFEGRSGSTRREDLE